MFNLLKSFFFINSNFVKNVTNTYLSPTKFLSRILQGSVLDPLIFQIYVNNMPQEIYLPFYLDGSCLIFQHLNIWEIEGMLNAGFVNICNWLVDNKVIIYLGNDQAKPILSVSQHISTSTWVDLSVDFNVICSNLGIPIK